MFFKVSNIGMVITVTLSYSRPLINFAINTAHSNDTNPYILPVRIHTFFEMSNIRDYIIVYFFLFPIIYMSICHMTAICVLVNLVFHICANLSILSYRIRNINVKCEKDIHRRIRSLVEIHHKIIWMAQSLDDSFNIILLDELLGNSIVLAISMYYVLVSYDTAELATCCTFVFFAFTALLMLYGFCVIGDQLTQQSINVLDAYYECNWLEMPVSSKKSLLICMIRARAFLHLTAGKFYIFSLGGFTEEQKDLDRAAVIISWNKKLLTTIGLWPHERNNLRFSINFGYFTFLMILEYLDLFLFIDDLEHVIMNLTENMAFSQIFVRMSMLWKYNDEIGGLITEAIQDFGKEKYSSIEERKLFINYNARSKLFVKLLMIFVSLTASSYYLTPVLVSLGNGLPEIEVGNVTQTFYLLPYRFHVFYPLENLQIYVITYILEMPFVFISGFGQTAADCIMVTLVFHICGQMSVLALRINNIDVDPMNSKKEIKKVVESHTRLLRMGKTVADAFSATLLAHLLGATSLVCVLGYQILTNFANGEKAVLISFLVFQFVVLLILYAHCTVGECLLTESAKVCEAFYACQWYDMPIESARCIVLCMARSQNPLCLTAGKFNTFCLSTLTDVLKTSMGYLSVLRSFL
ncbi:hypothetical protein KPH14_002609 [Odynerus spinipes]|uniref:Odorant receptor n=1 Tax=Odynerus spinipes TaxID=1348599 RepID=A0AAD9R853_9HYME|nr:hypothetical protein KPH14_002609 [Odynerus spinipes]